MFFILSKLLYFLLAPISWIFILLIVRLVVKSSSIKRKISVCIIIISVVFSNPFIYRSLVIFYQPKKLDLDKNIRFSVGILLGGLSMYDKNNVGYFVESSDRFIQTANLYHSGYIKKIIVSGGSGILIKKEPDEASFLRKELIRNGIPDSAIIIEKKSKNTYENAVFSKKIVDSLHLLPPYIIVTSAIHVPRSAKVFAKAGFTNYTMYPCNYDVVENKYVLEDYLIPDISLLKKWKDFIKEIVGTKVYQLTGKA